MSIHHGAVIALFLLIGNVEECIQTVNREILSTDSNGALLLHCCVAYVVAPYLHIFLLNFFFIFCMKNNNNDRNNKNDDYQVSRRQSAASVQYILYSRHRVNH